MQMTSNWELWPMCSIATAPKKGLFRERLIFPSYARPLCWMSEQREDFAHAILRGNGHADLRMVWHKIPNGNTFDYVVLDGRERLFSIWEFVDGNLRLPFYDEGIGDFSVANLLYAELPDELRSFFGSVSVPVQVIMGDEDRYTCFHDPL